VYAWGVVVVATILIGCILALMAVLIFGEDY
jgi:hypothetical protein